MPLDDILGLSMPDSIFSEAASLTTIRNPMMAVCFTILVRFWTV